MFSFENLSRQQQRALARFESEHGRTILKAFTSAVQKAGKSGSVYLSDVENSHFFGLQPQARKFFLDHRQEFVNSAIELFGNDVFEAAPPVPIGGPDAHAKAREELKKRLNPIREQISITTEEAKNFPKYCAEQERARKEDKVFVVVDPETGARVEIDGRPVNSFAAASV